MTIGKLSGQCDFGQKGQSYCNQRGQSCVAKRVKVAWLFHASDKTTDDETNRQMSINKYTPIHRVLTTYPQLIHRLVKRDSRYVSLINPVSTCTLGHCTTIESIAFTVGDDMETLLTYLKGEMEREDIQFKY